MNTHAATLCYVISRFGLDILVGEFDRGLDFLPGKEDAPLSCFLNLALSSCVA